MGVVICTGLTMLPLKWALLHYIHRCNSLRSFKNIHAQLVTTGIAGEELIINGAVGFFEKSVEFVDYACDFLKKFDCRVNSFSYCKLIARYAASDRPQTAFLVYRRMLRDGFWPDMYVFPAVLKSCAKFTGIGEGRQVHGVVVKMGFTCDLYVQNSLVYCYSVCGECIGAGIVFDEMLVRDEVSWSGIISGFVKAGLFDEAVALYLRMDVGPNITCLVSVLGACGRTGYLDLGKVVHGVIVKRGYEVGLEASNALMDMYAKCNCLCTTKQIFYELPEKDIVSWTSIISGLVRCKRPKESLELFCNMQTSGLEPDRVILTSVLSACASLGALEYGKCVHKYINHRGIKWDSHIGTAIIDMYAKCGCIELARKMFRELPNKNVFTWNALIGGLAMHGHGHEALEYFKEMGKVGMRPNEVTFLAILTACCHSGFVDEGRRYFYQMISQPYNLSPRLEHYGCMIDLLCRAGLLDQAIILIKHMPMSPDVLVWGALLNALNSSRNMELSQDLLDFLIELESQDSGIFVLLSNIFAANGRWSDVERVRRLMKEKGIKKTPASSLIEVDGETHEFVVGHTSQSCNEDIQTLLNILANQVSLEGRCI